MPRLNDEFIDALTGADGALKVRPNGYVIAEHEQDGISVEVGLTPWQEPFIGVRGTMRAVVMKGNLVLRDMGQSFEPGGIGEDGLHVAQEGERGEEADKRYLIVDSDEEEVLISLWDPNANIPDPQDGTPGGAYGDYSPAPQEDVESVKKIAKDVIDAGRITIDSQSASL